MLTRKRIAAALAVAGLAAAGALAAAEAKHPKAHGEPQERSSAGASCATQHDADHMREMHERMAERHAKMHRGGDAPQPQDGQKQEEHKH